MFEPSTAESRDEESQRRPELDGLRGLAILLVVYHHYVNAQLRPAAGSLLDYALLPGRLSWTGVDLFFLLSGYLLGGILLRHRESQGYFKTFYVRRACRILPLYLVCVAVLHLIHGPIWAARHPPLYQYLTFTQNFWMAAAGSFGGPALAVTWSLAIEEQFYLVIPALVRYVTPRRLWLALVACILLAPLLRLVLYLTLDTAYYASHVLLFTRMDTLMLGVLAAWLHSRGFVFPRRPLYLAWFVLGAGMLYISCKDGGATTNLIVRIFCYDWFALFYLSMLLIATQGGLRWLRTRALTYIGLISYGLYLLHGPVHALLNGGRPWAGGRRWVLLTLGASLVVFALATLSWEFFEKPFVKWGHRHRYREGARAGPLRAAPAEAE